MVVIETPQCSPNKARLVRAALRVRWFSKACCAAVFPFDFGFRVARVGGGRRRVVLIGVGCTSVLPVIRKGAVIGRPLDIFTFTNVKWLWLLGPPTPAAIVADVARLLAGASRTTRIHVLSLTAFVPTSVLTDLVVRSVLLLAGDGLLMVVTVRFAGSECSRR